MNYWLMKSEPDVFGIDDLKRVGVEPWDGVRNYQARNMMRDQMQVGDLAFFYHSNTKVPGVVGIMEIVRAGYPDDCAWDPEHKYYDPKSSPDNPRWYRVDVAYKETFPQVVPLETLKSMPQLADMALVRRGNRLSIMPVTADEWEIIQQMAKMETDHDAC